MMNSWAKDPLEACETCKICKKYIFQGMIPCIVFRLLYDIMHIKDIVDAGEVMDESFKEAK